LYESGGAEDVGDGLMDASGGIDGGSSRINGLMGEQRAEDGWRSGSDGPALAFADVYQFDVAGSHHVVGFSTLLQ